MPQDGLVSIIIPTYNEAENIGNTLSRIVSALTPGGIKYEVLVVDDASVDGTADIAEKMLGGKGRVIRRAAVPKSLSLSVLDGMAEAKGDIIIVMDGDTSHPPELIPSLINNLREGYDLVIGSRYVRGGGVLNFPFSRKIVSRCACALGKLFTKINDNNSGFFGIQRRCLDGLRLKPSGFKIGLEIFVKARFSSFKEIPYVFINRQKGESKLRIWVSIQYLYHILRLSGYKLALKGQVTREDKK